MPTLDFSSKLVQEAFLSEIRLQTDRAREEFIEKATEEYHAFLTARLMRVDVAMVERLDEASCTSTHKIIVTDRGAA